MEKRWQFKQWYGLDDNNTHTIEGEKYKKLIELCFTHATYFSLQLAPWTAATDNQLQQALEPYKVKHLKTNHWYRYGTPPESLKFEVPLMNIFLYRASDKAKQVVLSYTNTLFLGLEKDETLMTLEDICFFREEELFFGTVSYEGICSVKGLSEQFIKELLKIGDWEEINADPLEILSLKGLL